MGEQAAPIRFPQYGESAAALPSIKLVADRRPHAASQRPHARAHATHEPDFLAGGGDMGERIRAHNWSATLGAPEGWPSSLRTALRLMLTARSPMSIAWGTELLQFHNDALARTLGANGHCPAIGRPMRESCVDMWSRAAPLVDDAMQRGESGVLEDQLVCLYRNGYAEETYLTLGCNPIGDDVGGIGGVMLTVTETTQRVLGVRRTAALRDVAASATAARSVDEACRQVLAAASRHPSDIPFALLYVRDADRTRARLAASAGLPAGTAASPPLIDLAARPEISGWPVATVLASNDVAIVDDLLTRFGTLPAGDWPLAPRCAVVVPVTPAGWRHPEAALVAGVSAGHALDAEYRGFIDLVAKQVAAAIAGGRVHEDEERHAEARAAAKLARARRRARVRALEARFEGVLEERTRLAREIHDTLLQSVTGVALQLRASLPRVRTAPHATADALERIAELAEATIREARQAVWDMRPAALAKGDFVRAVQTAAEHAAANASLDFSFAVTGRARRVSPDAETIVLRVVQESLANVVKHAEAQMVRLILAYGRRRLRVTVADDGKGFTVEPDFHSYAGHWGLLGMQERATQVNGSLVVRSAASRGTEVVLGVPYAAAS